MATDNHTTIVGNLVEDPELRFTNNGIAVTNLRVAVTQCIQQDDQWRDGETNFFTLSSNEPYSTSAAGALWRWRMDAYGTARLAAKDAESAIVARICEDFNLTPVLAKAHYEQMARYFAEYGQVPARSGELCYLAVAAEEPAGKPIAACRKLQIRLELAALQDVGVLGGKGLAAMRQGRLARLARQARVQGALLTVEDLAYLTCSSLATVKRDLAWLRAHGQAVPTRGQIRDIGPGVSHKTRVVQLYLWGLQFTDIELRTAHSQDAIRRYLADFRQIAALYARDASVPEIRAATGHSAGLIAEYIGIYERARREFPAAPRLADLLGAGAKKGGPR